jgi:predicted NBD/HSP70 family sugar kinase
VANRKRDGRQALTEEYTNAAARPMVHTGLPVDTNRRCGEVRPDLRYLIEMALLGIDIGGSSVKAAAVEEGQTKWTGQSRRYARPTREGLVAAIREAIGGREIGNPAVGLCVPGLLDERKETVTYSVNVPGLMGLRLPDLVRDAVGHAGRLLVANDSNAAARDIYTARQLTGRLLVIVLGTGVGMSVMDAGGPLAVDGESPGHIGQMDVSVEGHPVIGPDGGAGSLEGYVGAAALAERYGSSEGTDPVERIGPDDPAILALARTIRICHAIYRPQHVCLAGGVGIRMGRLLPDLRRRVERDLTRLAREGWTLTVGDDDFHAARGVAKLAGP